MANATDTEECKRNCWIIGAIVGVVLWLLLMIFGDWGFLSSLLVGVIVAFLAAFGLITYRCGSGVSMDAGASRSIPTDTPQPDKKLAAGSADAGAASDAATDKNKGRAAMPAESASGAASDGAGAEAALPTTSAVAASGTDATIASKAFQMQPSKPLAGQDDLASRKGSWKYESKGTDAPKKVTASAPVAKSAKAKKASAPSTSTPQTTEDSSDQTTASSRPAAKRAAVTADGQPEILSGPRATGSDNLKLISGVGPKLEQTLNELGIWHFDQVASWRKKEIEWVDARLKFKGRIERDGWIAQAKILAKGGATEFSKRKKK